MHHCPDTMQSSQPHADAAPEAWHTSWTVHCICRPLSTVQTGVDRGSFGAVRFPAFPSRACTRRRELPAPVNADVHNPLQWWVFRGRDMLDELVSGSEAWEPSLTSVAKRARDDAALGLWSSHTLVSKGLKSTGSPTSTTKAGVSSRRAVRAREKRGTCVCEGPSFFPHALNLCLIHGLGTRQNGSLFESAHGAATGPDGCSQRAHMHCICRNRGQSRHSRCWRALGRYVPTPHLVSSAKKQSLQQPINRECNS